VQETINDRLPKIMNEIVHETVNNSGNKTLARHDVVDSLDQIIRDGEPEFLDERNLRSWSKQERMLELCYTLVQPYHDNVGSGSCCSGVEIKVRNVRHRLGFNDMLSLV
jgi:hypothetical protein